MGGFNITESYLSARQWPATMMAEEQTQRRATSEFRVALFTPSAPPVLRFFKQLSVAKFCKEHKWYELAGAKYAMILKLREIRYPSRNDRSMLKHLVFMGTFYKVVPDATKESLKEENVEVSIDGLVKYNDAGGSLASAGGHERTAFSHALHGTLCMHYHVLLRDVQAA